MKISMLIKLSRTLDSWEWKKLRIWMIQLHFSPFFLKNSFPFDFINTINFQWNEWNARNWSESASNFQTVLKLYHKVHCSSDHRAIGCYRTMKLMYDDAWKFETLFNTVCQKIIVQSVWIKQRNQTLHVIDLNFRCKCAAVALSFLQSEKK